MATHLGSLIIENDLTVRDLVKLAAFTTPGEYLTIIDAEGTVGVAPTPQLNRRKIALADTGTGTVEGDWNLQSPTLTVGPLDLITVTWATNATEYLFMGSDGIYGLGGTHTAIASDFFQFSGSGTSNEFLDSVFRILNGADLTKQIAFNAAPIAPGNTRTITMPDHDVDLGDLPQPPLTGVSDPNSTVNPRYSGDIFVDTTALHVWISTSTSNTSWKRNDNAKTTISAVIPIVTDDSSAGYEPFSLWLDTANSNLYICTDDTAGAAVWILTAGDAGSTEVLHDVTATISVGAIGIGEIVTQGTDLTEFVEQLLSPTIQPTKINNFATLNGISTATLEVGTLYIATLSAGYNTGTIQSKDGSPDVNLTGLLDSAVYAGPGADPNTGAVSTILANTVHQWTTDVDYLAETAPYYDSTGTESHIFDGGRGPSTTSDASSIVTGKYRYWWDTVNTPNTSAGVRALPSGQRGFMGSVTFGMTIDNEVNDIAVYIRATYGSFVVTHDENFDLDITSLFFESAISVDDANGAPIQYSKMATNTGTFAGFDGINHFTVTITD